MKDLECSHLSFSYETKEVLKDISFHVQEGEWLSVVGPNGSGKSTLLKCLNRILRNDNGKKEEKDEGIFLKGRALEAYSQKELAKHMSYVPQASAFSPSFTVREFVQMGRYPYQTLFRPMQVEDHQAVSKALEQTGLQSFSERPLHALSGGESQKVYLAASLAQGASILLLDEPTTFLDPKHQVDVLSLLKKIKQEENVTVLLVTHDINHAASCGNRVLALKEGEVAFWGEAENFMDPQILEDIYDTPFECLRSSSERIVVMQKELILRGKQ